MATEAELAHTAGTCINEHGGALGMPQLCAEWWPNQIFWLLVTLVVIYLVLSKIALPRISAVLADRKGTITNDLAAAEELKQKAVAAEKAYNDALATAEIQKDLDAATAKADAEIAAKAAESEKSIAEIRDGAAVAVAEVARDVAAALVGALGQGADAKTVTAAVTARLKG